MNPTSAQNGVAVLLSVFVLTSILAISFGISAVFLKELRFGREAGFYIPAFFAADSGIEKILTLRSDPKSFTQCDTKTKAQTNPVCQLSNGAIFWVVAKAKNEDGCAAANFCVVSNGEYKGTRRAVEVNY
jgi:hypothetical protein